MDGGVEGAADVATGAVLARAVEGSRAAAGPHEGACRNCGTALVGPHCHRCGQAGHLHRTIGGFAHELIHGVLHFEGKAWTTLPMLALRPGEMTRRYIDGERAKFVSPTALFLFSVFLLFAVLGPASAPGRIVSVDGATQDLARAAAASRSEVERLAAERRRLAAAGRPTVAVDEALTAARAETVRLERAQSVLPRVGAASGVAPGAAWLEGRIEHAMENPDLFLYKLRTSAYKYSWALIPLSLPLIWLLFAWRRRFGLYDHAVFATYSLAFMSLLVVALAVVARFGPASAEGWVWAVLVVAAPLHMFRQLKGTYLLTRAGAAWRTAALLGVVLVASGAFGLILLYLGVAK